MPARPVDRRRRRLLAAVAQAAALAHVTPSLAQASRVPRIAFIAAASPATIAVRTEAFRRGLQERGYVEGRTIVVDYLFGEERLDRLPALVAQAVSSGADILVSAGPSVTRAARAATATVPIVMAFDPDPVGAGFVASLSKPGGNVTGMSSVGAEMGSKQLELLKQVLPLLKRAVVIGNSAEPGNALATGAVAEAAPRLGVELAIVDVRAAEDIAPAFAQAAKSGAQAVLVLSSPIVTFHARQFAEHAMKLRLPAVFPYVDVVEAGGLMHYGVSMRDLFRRAAGYVDRILRGAKPADLPVEQPSQFELVVNRKAARQMGIEVPAAVLARADRVID
jgi:putative ABC transport system substrate-binding protein